MDAAVRPNNRGMFFRGARQNRYASHLYDIFRIGFGRSKPLPYSERFVVFVGERLAAPAAERWFMDRVS